MGTTGLYQILVDLGVDHEKAERALATLACEDQVATKEDLAKLENRLIKWIVSVAVALFIGLGFLIRPPISGS